MRASPGCSRTFATSVLTRPAVLPAANPLWSLSVATAGWTETACAVSAAVAEETADEEDGGGRSRRRPCNRDSLLRPRHVA